MSDLPLWPTTPFALSAADHADLLQRLTPDFAEELSRNQLPAAMSSELSRLYLPLAGWLNRQRPAAGPLLVGVNGSQGSGKSTLCNLLKSILESAFNCRTCIISIDDLYLPQLARQQLAKETHPLLATRGVPGTHDIPLGLELFAGLKNAPDDEISTIPRFDKATDDRLPVQQWEEFSGAVDLVLFEGWCVGATPQATEELAAPLNLLEEQEDPDGRWRSYVNQQLAGPYRQLFAQLDLLLMLKIPDWEMVYHWRKRQEEQLAARRSGCGVMGETALRRFIQHYERLTRHQLAVLPKKADLVMGLNRGQRATSIHLR